LSTKATNWAWEQELPPSQKFVLVKLADNADEDGYCFPGTKYVAEKTGLGHSTVRAHVQWLQENEYIRLERRDRPDGSQASNHCWLLMDRQADTPLPESSTPLLKSGTPPPDSSGPLPDDAEGGAESQQGGCQQPAGALPAAGPLEPSSESKKELPLALEFPLVAPPLIQPLGVAVGAAWADLGAAPAAAHRGYRVAGIFGPFDEGLGRHLYSLPLDLGTSFGSAGLSGSA